MIRIVVAIVLIAHGLGHSMGFLASWTTIPSGLSGGHWLFSNEVAMDSLVGRVWGLLWLVALVGTTGAGLGLLFSQEWWRPLAIASATLSLVAIVPWLNVMPAGSAIGAVAVDILTLGMLVFPWGEQLAGPR